MFRSLSFAALIVAGTTLSTGCLSFQSYGSPTRGHRVSEGATRADVLASLGEPDSVYKNTDTEVFFYKGYRGQNWFGVYAKVKRDDTAVVMDQKGNVISSLNVEVGRGQTLFPLLGLDATTPWKTTILSEGPENYSFSADEPEAGAQ